MTRCFCLLALLLLACACICAPDASAAKKLDKPQLSERWFSIYVDKERVGFYRQKISEVSDGYRIEGDGSVHMRVMGFSKEASSREIYLVAKNMTLRSFEVEQTLNGDSSRVTGRITDNGLRVKSESKGSFSEKQLKFKGDLYPSPSLNIFPLLRDASPGKTYRAMTFDAEEVKIKEVKVSVLGEEKTPDGQPALKLRNDLYPFVSNDIWVDLQGNTLYESIRDGLVTTKAEDPRLLSAFVGGLAFSKKDLIYDFSMVRLDPPLKDVARLTGLAVEISGWSDELPLLQEGGQSTEKAGDGRIILKTGSAVVLPVQPVAAQDSYLKAAEKIEADAPEIVAIARELAKDKKDTLEIARALALWTADRLKDTVEDGGGALASLKSRKGNCQTHARLYTALARAAGIPTRFVSGLVYQEGQGFLYHSWAESLTGAAWVAVDPTYNQLPADPTHLKFFEGHTPNDMIPIIALIGRIKVVVLESKY